MNSHQPERRRPTKPSTNGSASQTADEGLAPEGVHALQESLGNAAVGRLLEGTPQPGDASARPASPPAAFRPAAPGNAILMGLQQTMGNQFVQRLAAPSSPAKTAETDESQTLR
jgi:hypothetical protein